MTGTLDNIDDRPTLRFERHYDHDVERVWRAITDPDELRHWFPPGEELEVTESEAPRLLLIQLAWLAGMAVLSRWVFAVAIRRITVQGG